MQACYAAKEIALRILIGFIAANLSMAVMTRAVSLANPLSAELAGGGQVNQQATAGQLGGKWVHGAPRAHLAPVSGTVG